MNEAPLITNRELLVDIHTKVNVLHNVVIGDRANKNFGLVDKVYKLEKAEKNRSKLYILISSITAGVSAGVYKFIESFK